MNFPTAWQYLKGGTPIARAAWASELELGPSQWLTYSGGAFWINRSNYRALIEPGDIAEADLRAIDWTLPKCIVETFSALPDFPRTGIDGASSPLFDIFNPPCKSS